MRSIEFFRGAVGYLCVGILAPLWAAPADAAVAISLDSSTVSVTGVSPGGETALLSVSRMPQGFSSIVTPGLEILLDEDTDAEVVHSPTDGVAEQSVWIAVDRSTGELAVAWPDETEVAEVELDLASALTPGTNGDLTRLEAPIRSLEMAVVRPGGGAWHFAGSDGGPADYGEGDDAAVTAELSLATPLGTSPAFDGVSPGDVLVGIGPKTLEFFAVQVAEEEE